MLISVLPALGIIIYSGLDRGSREIEDAKSDALEAVKSLAYEHERVMGSTRQFLMTLAKLPDIQNLNKTGSNPLLQILLKQNPLYGSWKPIFSSHSLPQLPRFEKQNGSERAEDEALSSPQKSPLLSP